MNKITEEKSFEELLQESQVSEKWLNPGQKVEGLIVDITDEWIFLDLGGKSEGHLDRKELLDETGNLTVQKGDTIQAYFLASRNNEKIFTTRISGSQVGKNQIEEAWKSGIPVEGKVEKEVKGGFEIKIAGTLKGFCPFSLMGLRRIDDPKEYVGNRLSFKVIEFTENGRNIILSHRAILKEEQQQKKELLKESLKEGMKVNGTITTITNFGAFVSIGELEGLIPISEIAWGHVENIKDLLSVGQEVEVVITNLDWDKDRFSFSLKHGLPDPWESVEEKFSSGSCHTGKVERLTKFGAFVSLEQGVDGLIHISKLGKGKRINHPGDVLTNGEIIEVQVENVDKEKKRISLSLASTDKEETLGNEKEDYKQYTGKSSTSLGSLGDIFKQKLAGKKWK